MTNFQDKRILIFGGSSGIGLATARRAAAAGAATVIVSRSQARIDQALSDLPATAEGYTADLSSEQEVERVLGEIGPIDHLVYTAGENLVLSPLSDTDLSSAQTFLRTRMWGALAAVKHAQTRIKPGGSIVLMSGSASSRPQTGWTLGAAICGAMEAITRALAVELAPVRVNSVAPGVVRTDLWSSMPAGDREQIFSSVADQLPVGRVGEADDIAQGILYLIGNGYTTGTTLEISGGALLV
jgi:NAD(P)-dependent dehydrogenase (short-subunit alcohol dehydrogenase family)